MKEIGGYIELEDSFLPMLHEKAIALNSGTSCLAYIIRANKIAKIRIPYFLCDCVKNICKCQSVKTVFYKIEKDFLPRIDTEIESDEWIYLVNYYGQLNEEQIERFVNRYKRVIVDQAQAYFEKPIRGAHTLYTCRKFFGVPDGAFLYTNTKLDETIVQDESFERMHFLLGRYERTASEFYNEYVENNLYLADQPIKKMSKLTNNLLRGIDYERIKKRRTRNFNYLYKHLGEVNLLNLKLVHGAYAYPFLSPKGAEIRKKMLEDRIYIPILWPNVLKDASHSSLEYYYAKNILPLPVDQRYDIEDMQILVDKILDA